MTAKLSISIDLLREILDLPDDIVIVGARTADLRTDEDRDLRLPITLELEVNSVHLQPEDKHITPVYDSRYEGDIARVTLQRIDGYRGPIDRRPSYWRKQADGVGAPHPTQRAGGDNERD